jgi:hypothetical protein
VVVVVVVVVALDEESLAAELAVAAVGDEADDESARVVDGDDGFDATCWIELLTNCCCCLSNLIVVGSLVDNRRLQVDPVSVEVDPVILTGATGSVVVPLVDTVVEVEPCFAATSANLSLLGFC